MFFFPVKKNAFRENFQFSVRETPEFPVKKSWKVPVKNKIYPWKFLLNHIREKKWLYVKKIDNFFRQNWRNFSFFLAWKKKSQSVKKSEKDPVKILYCAWKYRKMHAWKWICIREKNGKKRCHAHILGFHGAKSYHCLRTYKEKFQN